MNQHLQQTIYRWSSPSESILQEPGATIRDNSENYLSHSRPISLYNWTNDAPITSNLGGSKQSPSKSSHDWLTKNMTRTYSILQPPGKYMLDHFGTDGHWTDDALHFCGSRTMSKADSAARLLGNHRHPVRILALEQDVDMWHVHCVNHVTQTSEMNWTELIWHA